MADIVERLLNPANVFYEYVADEGAMLREAADEIERLREALRQIIKLDDEWKPETLDDYSGVAYEHCGNIARTALGEKE